jgi:uncharacterized Zn finger protein
MSWGWGFTPYVSVAEKRRRAEKAALALVNKGQKLNPVRINGRKIARSFWGHAWCENLESYSDYANRLPRGRSYVRNGSVIDLRIEAGTIAALVNGSSLYRVKILINPVENAAWKSLKSECSGQVGSLLDLLQGRLSTPVMEVITHRQNGLFPKLAEIKLDCSCPDWADMCKHVAATLYAVGARLDESPEMLFALRGADHRELITAATESVTEDASSSEDGSHTLFGENLADVFGIEIDSLKSAPKVTPAKTRIRENVEAAPKKTPASAISPAKTSPRKKRGKAQPGKKAKTSAKRKKGVPKTRSRTKGTIGHGI